MAAGPTRRAAQETSRLDRRLIAVTTVFALIGAGGAYAWTNYEDKVREILGWEIPNDYTTTGNGVEAVVVIQSGDIGGDVAQELLKAKVTMTFDAVYNYLLAHPDVSFQPGNYKLQEKMSAASAVAALQDPTNKILNSVTIPEGTAAVDIYALLASGLNLPVEDFTAAAEDFKSYGVPAEAKSIEGFLFPATYQFDPGTTATQALQTLVTESITRLDAAGVAPEDRVKTVILASIIQREAGQNVDDMAKIGRVFLNRIDQGMHLNPTRPSPTAPATPTPCGRPTPSAPTRATSRTPTPTPAARSARSATPATPRSTAPSTRPTGKWLFFVPINLKTGETVFSRRPTSTRPPCAAARLVPRERRERLVLRVTTRCPARLAVLGSPIAHSQVAGAARAPRTRCSGSTGLRRDRGRGRRARRRSSTGSTRSWRGLSLTMPLKREVLPLLDRASPWPSEVGAANTVLLARRAASTGFNTDVARHRRGVPRGRGRRARLACRCSARARRRRRCCRGLAELGASTRVGLGARRRRRREPCEPLAERLGLELDDPARSA